MERKIGICKNCQIKKILAPLDCSHQICMFCLSSIYARMIIGLYSDLCSGVKGYDGWIAKLGCPYLCQTVFKISIKRLKKLINCNPAVNDNEKYIINNICEAPSFQEIPTWFHYCRSCNILGWSKYSDYHCDKCFNCTLCFQSHKGQACNAINIPVGPIIAEQATYSQAQSTEAINNVMPHYPNNIEISQTWPEMMNEHPTKFNPYVPKNYTSSNEIAPQAESIMPEPIKKSSHAVYKHTNPRKNITNIIRDIIGPDHYGDYYEISEFEVIVNIEEEKRFNNSKLQYKERFYEKLISLSSVKKTKNGIVLVKGVNRAETMICNVMLPIGKVADWAETEENILLPSKDFLLTKYKVTTSKNR